MHAGATVTGSTMTVEGCGSESLQGDVRFAEVMGLMGAHVQWQPYSITITGMHFVLLVALMCEKTNAVVVIFVSFTVNIAAALVCLCLYLTTHNEQRPTRDAKDSLCRSLWCSSLGLGFVFAGC